MHATIDYIPPIQNSNKAMAGKFDSTMNYNNVGSGSFARTILITPIAQNEIENIKEHIMLMCRENGDSMSDYIESVYVAKEKNGVHTGVKFYIGIRYNTIENMKMWKKSLTTSIGKIGRKYTVKSRHEVQVEQQTKSGVSISKNYVKRRTSFSFKITTVFYDYVANDVAEVSMKIVDLVRSNLDETVNFEVVHDHKTDKGLCFFINFESYYIASTLFHVIFDELQNNEKYDWIEQSMTKNVNMLFIDDFLNNAPKGENAEAVLEEWIDTSNRLYEDYALAYELILIAEKQGVIKFHEMEIQKLAEDKVENYCVKDDVAQDVNEENVVCDVVKNDVADDVTEENAVFYGVKVDVARANAWEVNVDVVADDGAVAHVSDAIIASEGDSVEEYYNNGSGVSDAIAQTELEYICPYYYFNSINESQLIALLNDWNLPTNKIIDLKVNGSMFWMMCVEKNSELKRTFFVDHLDFDEFSFLFRLRYMLRASFGATAYE